MMAVFGVVAQRLTPHGAVYLARTRELSLACVLTCSLLPGCVELGPRLTRSNLECVILQGLHLFRS